MLNRIIQSILKLLVSENDISEEDINIYYFGLECIILKLVHYVSYIIIGVIMDDVISLLISACVFMPLRSFAGGYHAKTRLGCYMFSCMMVVCMCLTNRVTMYNGVYVMALIIYNIIITVFSPIESSSNILDDKEKIIQKYKTFAILGFFNILIIITMYKNVTIYRYLVNGIGLVAFLLLLGTYTKIYKTRNSVE